MVAMTATRTGGGAAAADDVGVEGLIAGRGGNCRLPGLTAGRPPKSRFFLRPVRDGEVRGVDSDLLPVQAVDAGGDETGGQQGALDRVRRLAAEEHALDLVALGAEEVGQGRARRRHRQVHLGRERALAALEPRREVEVLHQAVEQDHRAPEAVEVLVVVGDGILHEAFHLVDGRERVVEAAARRGQGVAAAQRRLEQVAGPEPVAVRLPETVAAERLEPAHTGLAPLPALDHALQGFEGVEVVAVDPADADADRLVYPGGQGHVDRRGAPGDREGGAGHESESHLPGGVVHLARPLPVPREVLVVEDRGGSAGGAVDGDDLPEELVARVEPLPLLVGAVGAVLADEEDAVDGEAAAAQGQGVGRGRVDGQVLEAGLALAAEVVPGELVDVERHQVHRRAVMAAAPAVPFEEAVADVLAVGVLAVLGDDGGDPGTRRFRGGGHLSLSGFRGANREEGRGFSGSGQQRQRASHRNR